VYMRGFEGGRIDVAGRWGTVCREDSGPDGKERDTSRRPPAPHRRRTALARPELTYPYCHRPGQAVCRCATSQGIARVAGGSRNDLGTEVR